MSVETAFADQRIAGQASVPDDGDSLSASLAWIFVLVAAQRGVGFLRSVFFVRFLDPRELGRWDMALGFLELAAPVLVLGIPGTFGRYVERYRQRSQLGVFLRHTVGRDN